MKAKKFIEKKIEGEYEIIKNHVIDIDISNELIEDICFNYLHVGEDPELDYEKGIITNEDGDLAYVKIGKFLDAVDDMNTEKDNSDEESLELDKYQKIQKMKDYQDYELYCYVEQASKKKVEKT